MLPSSRHLQFMNQHSSKWAFVSKCNVEIICIIPMTGLDPDMVTFLHFTQHHFCSRDGPSSQGNMKSFFYNIVNPQFSLDELTAGGYRCPGKLVSPRHRSNKYTISRVEMISLVYRYFVELYYGVLFKVIICDSRTKNDIGLYSLVCPASEEIFEKKWIFCTKMMVALTRITPMFF